MSKPAIVTGIKQTAKSTDSITITWNTLKNVDGYRVYCYDQGGKLLSSSYAESNRYMATDVSGKYIYKVRAYIKNGKIYSLGRLWQRTSSIYKAGAGKQAA